VKVYQIDERQLRLLACEFAERALLNSRCRPEQRGPQVEAVAAARRFASGEAEAAEMLEAGKAALRMDTGDCRYWGYHEMLACDGCIAATIPDAVDALRSALRNCFFSEGGNGGAEDLVDMILGALVEVPS